jgi:transposase
VIDCIYEMQANHIQGDRPLKKKSTVAKSSERVAKPGKARGPVQREAKEVMAELVAKLSEKLEPRPAKLSEGKGQPQGTLGPNRDRLTVGIDLGDKWSNFCILGLDGEKLSEGELPTAQQDFAEFFQPLAAARVVMEVGTHSAWARDVVASCGHEVLVANPRQMEGPKRRKRKNDRIDAHKLARVGRMDPQSLFVIEHRSVEVRQDLVAVRARNAVVAARRDLINVTRGLVKSMGGRLPKCSSGGFPHKVEEALPAELREVLLPLVQLVETLSGRIKEYDETIETLGCEKYPHTKLLRQVKGVGPITALAYVLTLEKPERFVKSRDVGPYLGLVPKQEDSGDSQPQLRITKMGDVMVRQLLVGSAHYILGPFGPDTDLRRYGLRLSQRGGKNAKKRAVVAVARKLAVLLHRLWVGGEVYEPLRHALPKATPEDTVSHGPAEVGEEVAA